MARILHVEDDQEWLGLTRRALPGHQVDSAASYPEALALIQENPPYDLALVDLYLNPDGGELGAELLDLLRIDYPSTARIVLTGKPPAGALRANIFERYGVEDIIIKGNLTLADITEVVSNALSRDIGYAMPREVKIRKSELSQRYRDWHARLESLIQARIVLEEERVSQAAGQREGMKLGTRGQLGAWVNIRERFRHECSEIETSLSDAKSMEDALAAMQKLDHAMARFASEVNELRPIVGNQSGARG